MKDEQIVFLFTSTYLKPNTYTDLPLESDPSSEKQTLRFTDINSK